MESNVIIHRLVWSRESDQDFLLGREWLVTNGLGGYSSGTLAGVNTRRYHGLLVAALPSPLGRVLMLNHLTEELVLPSGTAVRIGGDERAERDLDFYGSAHLVDFRLENLVPVWKFDFDGIVIEKRVLLPHMQNTVYVNYRVLTSEGTVRLVLRPSMHFRPHGDPVNGKLTDPYHMSVYGTRYEVRCGDSFPALRLMMRGERSAMTADGGSTREIYYRTEADRGYESRGLLWSPGYFRAYVQQGQQTTLIASTEEWTTILALKPEDAFDAEQERCRRLRIAAPPEAQDETGSRLVMAADQFVIVPAARIEHEARALAAGQQLFTIIAGYYWFTDWGRDTMISLEGLTLCTGRPPEAGWILRLFAEYVRKGLIPNMFPEGESEGLYNTADASLWFFHALARYLEYTNDKTALAVIMPRLIEIVEAHLKGTRFGIHVDPEDGLLHQGAEGYQLTWMDAKVDDWVVTPRRGKAVEINALWYNALRLLEGWLRDAGKEDEAKRYGEHADRAYESFNKRFWYEEGGYLYDVVDGEQGNDKSCRPNQVLAVSLPHPILAREHWESVMNIVETRLLTPVGLRSLAPGSADYKPKYFGNLRARDAAYHQGTVWAWLIGPFIDAWLKLHPDKATDARRFLEGFVAAMDEYCIGTIAEIFDAEAPFTPRGCIAQAWSVAEVLRCWIKTAPKTG